MTIETVINLACTAFCLVSVVANYRIWSLVIENLGRQVVVLKRGDDPGPDAGRSVCGSAAGMAADAAAGQAEGVMSLHRGLTVNQPHAWAIVAGPKRFENRSWLTSYRGWLLIHAGLSRKWLDDEPQYEGEPPPRDLIFGAVVGVALLTGCVPVAWAPRVPCAEGPWCWRLEQRRAIPEPIPWKGALGLWTPPDELVARVREQLERRVP